MNSVLISTSISSLKKMWFLLGFLTFLMAGCTKSDKTPEGRWAVVSIAPLKKEKMPEKPSTLLYWDGLSSGLNMRFHRDSLFINGNFQHTYHLKNSALYYQNEGESFKAFSFYFREDSLFLQNKKDNVLLKLVSKK